MDTISNETLTNISSRFARGESSVDDVPLLLSHAVQLKIDLEFERRNVKRAEAYCSNMIETLREERDMLKALLSNLLARLHRDGGHYEAEHGTAKAVVDAEKNWIILRQVDEARAAEIARLRSALHHISLDEYESSSSDTEKVHIHGRLARKALKGDEP